MMETENYFKPKWREGQKNIQSNEKKEGNKGKGNTAQHFVFINKQHFHPTSQIVIYHKLGPHFSN